MDILYLGLAAAGYCGKADPGFGKQRKIARRNGPAQCSARTPFDGACLSKGASVWARPAGRPPIGLFRVSGTVVLQRPIETRNQAVLAERLAQEAEGSGVQRAGSNALLGIGGHEDHRRAM